MASLLDEIIDGSTNGAIRTADLLRKVQVAATRVGASDVVRWVQQELQGYEDDAEIPSYRVMPTSVVGLFTGPMQSRMQHQLPAHSDFTDDFHVKMRQPLSTLQSFADADKDAEAHWPAWRVQQYENTGAFAIQFYGLFDAWNVITRQSLLGVVDTVRSKAMEFALGLQQDFPDAGSVGGPSLLTNSAVAPVVFNTTNNIYGHGTNIATGHDIAQKTVLKGNRQELERQAEQLGLSSTEAREFVDAVESEQGITTPQVTGFLEKVRTGAAAVGLSVSSDVIAGSLIELAKLYLGIA
ncbi:hypothetical protein [Paramicrobacterium agarici]|uniref:AbiTii domain-containing protein n=1 Tax=Paramicrobacterium agarici TaxID=630514 RepID=A0A2A9DT05_9MICO|nr:hypothetical protein [Microbacterium agarici]PFG29285.1 hypothetical protein ATJ78_0186 [Microbacterium agarici]